MRDMKKSLLTLVLAYSASIQALELPVLGELNIGGDLGAISVLPTGAVMPDGPNPVDALLLSSGVPVVSTLPLVGGLPVIDGRGLPIVRGVDEGMRLGVAVVDVLVSNPNASGGLPIIGNGELALIDLLLTGGPTFNFLALDAVLGN